MSIDIPTIEILEANLERLGGRFPDMPLAGVLLSRLLLYVGRGMSTLLDQEIRPFGLAEVEFRVLTTLFAQPDGVGHPSELCSRTGQSPANMSRISDALLELGFITRVPSVRDRRKLVLQITAPGEELVRRLVPTLYGPLKTMLEDFSDFEQRQLIEQLKRLAAKLHETMTLHPARPG
jgi:MarR family transcriptional repressor of emrRAB